MWLLSFPQSFKATLCNFAAHYAAGGYQQSCPFQVAQTPIQEATTEAITTSSFFLVHFGTNVARFKD